MAPIKKKFYTLREADCLEIPLNQEALQQRREDDNLSEADQPEEEYDEETQKEGPSTSSAAAAGKVSDTLKNIKRKAANLKKQIQKKKKVLTARELLEEQAVKNNMYTILMLLMLIWDDETTVLSLLPNLRMMTKALIKEKNFPLKKIIYGIQQAVANILKELQPQETASWISSIEYFVNVLLKGVYCTTFTKHCLSEEDINWIIDNYDSDLRGQSSSSSTMETTSTASTTAPTPTAAADAHSWNTSDPSKTSEDDILNRLYQVTSSPANIGAISQSIARRDEENVYIWSSPGASGYQVIKLDVFDYSKIFNKPKDKWWKQAAFRSTFITSSPVDLKAIMVKN